MENGTTALLVFGAIVLGVLGQGWASLLEHQRRRQTLDVIKAALQAGREPPPELYALLRKDTALRQPWGEVLVFGALSVGFWLAFAFGDEGRRTAFLVIAATMSVTALGCLALAMFKPGRPRDDERP
jgi:hypothetical protein